MFLASSYIISGCKLYFQNEGGWLLWLLSYNKHAWGSKKVWCTVNEASITIQAFTSQVPLDVFGTFFTFPRIQELVQKTKKWLHWNSKNLELVTLLGIVTYPFPWKLSQKPWIFAFFAPNQKLACKTSKCIDLVFCFKYWTKISWYLIENQNQRTIEDDPLVQFCTLVHNRIQK